MGVRLRNLILAAATPAAVGVLFLVTDYKDASVDLLHQPMTGIGQHLPWWSVASTVFVSNPAFGDRSVVAGGSTRWLAGVASVALAAWVVRKPSTDAVLLAASVTLFARSLFETQFWPYYVVPGAVFLALLVARRTTDAPKRYVVGLVGALLLYGSAPMAGVAVGYSPALAMALLVVTAALCLGAGYPGLAARFRRARAVIPLQVG